MAGVQGVITLLLTVSMLWASLCVSETNGQTSPCSITCSVVFDPVCGNNSVTYGNECELFRERVCRNGSAVKVHDGICSTTPPCGPGVLCPTVYMPLCGSDGRTYGNRCEFNITRICGGDPSLFIVHEGECRQTSTPCGFPCPDDYRPVCGSNGVTYSNECHLGNEIICRNSSLFKRHDGPCPQTTTPCGFPCPADYRPICGSNGVTYSNECRLRNAIICRDGSLFKRHDGPCPQTTTPCGFPCTFDYRPVCGSNGVTYSNECRLLNEIICRAGHGLYKRHDGPCLQTTTPCGFICTADYRPVCGSDGRTYGNKCQLDNEKRCRNHHLKKIHDGVCRGGDNCDWPCPDHHQKVCGANDVTYDSYCHFQVAQCKLKIAIKYDNAPCSAMKPTASTLMAMAIFLGSILPVIL